MSKHLARCTSEPHALLSAQEPLGPKHAAFASIGLITDQLRRNLKAKGVSLQSLFAGRDQSNIVEFTNRVKAFGIRP